MTRTHQALRWEHLLMEQDDDPEKRIAELERLQAQPPTYPPAPQASWQQPPTWQQPPQAGWQQPPQANWQQPQSWPQPAGQSGYGPPPAYHAAPPPTSQPRPSGGTRGRVGAVLSTIFLAVMGLGLLGLAGHGVYAYGVGKPTTATVVSCTNSRKSRHCKGTWTVDGVTQTGKIDGDGKGYRTGSTVNVRVHDGTAYTPESFSWWLWAGAAFTLFLAVNRFLKFRKRQV